MAFYESTLVAKQNLGEKELKILRDKYNEVINDSSEKVIKIENWGLLNLAKKIKSYKKAFFIHYKFEGTQSTLKEMDKKLKVDGSIIRHLIVKYNKLDTDNEYFDKDFNKDKVK